MFRHSCEVCHFANLQRPSDVTLADYWGWERTNPDFNADDKGCSLVLCNTEKGVDLFDLIKSDVNYLPVKIEDCLQPNLQRPSEPSPLRDEFEQDYAKRGFKYVIKKYMGLKSGLRYQLSRVKNFIKRKIKK